MVQEWFDEPVADVHKLVTEGVSLDIRVFDNGCWHTVCLIGKDKNGYCIDYLNPDAPFAVTQPPTYLELQPTDMLSVSIPKGSNVWG